MSSFIHQCVVTLFKQTDSCFIMFIRIRSDVIYSSFFSQSLYKFIKLFPYSFSLHPWINDESLYTKIRFIIRPINFLVFMMSFITYATSSYNFPLHLTTIQFTIIYISFIMLPLRIIVIPLLIPLSFHDNFLSTHHIFNFI